MNLRKKLSDLIAWYYGTKNGAVFIVNMQRFGSSENHSYILAVFSNIESALAAAEEEATNRGGKYEYEITRLIVDFPTERCWTIRSSVGPCNLGCNEKRCKLKELVDPNKHVKEKRK